MKNKEIAWIFAEMADLLEIIGESFFKVRAYRRASQTLMNLEVDIEELYQQGRLREIQGIGKELARKIGEYLETGTFAAYKKLKEQVPDGLRQMLQIPGIGPRSIWLFYDNLGITSLEALEEAARKRKIRTLPGMGSKTEATILRSIEMLRRQGDQLPLGLAYDLAHELLEYLLDLPQVQEASLSGSVRRWKELVNDIDLVVATYAIEDTINEFIKHPKIVKVIERDADRVLVSSYLKIKVELILVSPEQYNLTVFKNTGSCAHWEKLESLLEKGQQIMESISAGTLDESEMEFYSSLGLQYIPPELREDRGELEAAAQGKLPQLLEITDIRGDLHVHTNWSDGLYSLEQMLDAARARGYEYVAITDHSKSLSVARGLQEEQILEQRRQIEKYNREHPDFRVLSGIEVDILKDARLDFSDDFLKDMDLVIAAIHTDFKQDKELIMDRIMAALKNEHVDILAHPTGRMLSYRKPYAIDIEQVIDMAIKTNTALEINAAPERLDLDDVNSRSLVEKGGLLAINTDAHDWRKLDDMKFGVMCARRGWVSKESVINTWPFEKLQKWLNKK